MVSEVARTARKFCLGGRLIVFFLNSLGDDAKQVFSLFVDADGINYGKKMYLDTCHSYFYDGCCEQRGIGG